MRTAETIEQAKELNPQNSGKARKKLPEKFRLAQWKPGQSGNPGGRPKNDVAKEIAQAVFEGNQEAAYKALGATLLKGNAYVFKELADRAYGKLTEKFDVTVNSEIVERLGAARKRRNPASTKERESS